MSRRGAVLIYWLVVGLCLGWVVGPTLAQDGLLQPVDPSGNTLGEVSATAPTARFVVPSMGNESAQLTVFGITSGFAPRFRVLGPDQLPILDIGNGEGASTASGTAFFTAAGIYVIEIESATSTPGQFMLNIQPGAPLPPPVVLALGQAVPGVVGSASPVLIYEFTGVGTPQTLTVLSTLPDIGPAFSLHDQVAVRVIATSDGTLLGLTHYLPGNTTLYRVEVQAGSGRDIPFTICFGCAPSGGTDTTSGGTTVATPAASAACTVSSSVGGNVNVRVGPGTQYVIISALLAGQSYPVLGQLQGGGWYQVDVNGVVGWVGASVTRLEGDCGALPPVAPPVNAPLIPTIAPTATATLQATTASTLSATATPTITPTTDSNATATPTATPTEIATSTPTATPTEMGPVTTEEP